MNGGTERGRPRPRVFSAKLGTFARARPSALLHEFALGSFFHFNKRLHPGKLPRVDTSAPQLLPLLKQYFGFTSFRPLQEEIIRDALDGKDVFALLPTGGGKSLCFQLPAMARTGLTVVVSPLIALMKDQVDGLQASGVPATFLNSSLATAESRERLHGLHNGE